MYSIAFADLPVGRLFHADGNDYLKQSNRTARLLSVGRTFYFKKTEIVHPIAY